MGHATVCDLAGKTVKLNICGAEDEPLFAELLDQEYRIEDWWDRVHPQSWMDAVGNPAAMKYAIRAGFAGLPLDDEVVYGKVGFFGHIVHVSELGDVIDD